MIDSIPLLRKGFRPFFFGSAIFASIAALAWVGVLHGWLHSPAYLDPIFWHAHEMVFGFTSAVFAGFLLTAVSNWTGRETAARSGLLVLAVLWACGRIAMFTPLPGAVVALVDALFLPALALVIARPIVATKNYRNLIVVGVLTVYAVANVLVHMDALGVLVDWRRRATYLALDSIVVMMLIIATRVFPMFTKNATRVPTIHTMPRLDAAAIGGMAVCTIVDLLFPTSSVRNGLFVVTGAFTLARTFHWGAWHTRRVPLLWILHTGHFWIGIGLILRGAARTLGISESVGTHAITVGAIGALTLGMMARVALGHTGRMLEPPRSVVFGFVAVSLAALVRVVVPALSPSQMLLGWTGAGALWATAFALYVGSYAKILWSPRVDGGSG